MPMPGQGRAPGSPRMTPILLTRKQPEIADDLIVAMRRTDKRVSNSYSARMTLSHFEGTATGICWRKLNVTEIGHSRARPTNEVRLPRLACNAHIDSRCRFHSGHRTIRPRFGFHDYRWRTRNVNGGGVKPGTRDGAASRF